MHPFTRRLADSRRHLRVIVALVLALALVGTAVAASTSTSFKGKTKQGVKVTLRATATKAMSFKASPNVLCGSVVTGKNKLVLYAVSLTKPSKLKNGRFTMTFKGASSTTISVTGRINGSSASGKLNIKFSKTIGTTSTGLLDIAACQLKTTWTAKA
ncbi:MAG: hypothetical protein ABSC51_08095 [Gaiellaceae bacterium]|jgi:hypothetical protein